MDSTRRAVVTGATQGFGAAVAAALRDAGWTVVRVCRTPPPDMDRFVVTGDVTDPTTATAVADALGEDPLELLVNNAGLSGGRAALTEVDTADLRRSFATNVIAPLQMIRACLPNLLAAEHPLVINVSSRLASLTRQADDHYRQGVEITTSYGYRISKAAQNMLTIAVAQEFAGAGLATWALHPGRLTTRLGSRQADTSAAQAAARLVQMVDARDRSDLRATLRHP